MKTNPITIPKVLPKDTALSYDFLREEGIKLIQKLSADTWTDHNAHDPGITILEQVCYAITDLAYRIDYDIKDLLGNNDKSSYNDLYSPATILTVNPVTLLDLRKIVMDVAGVKNAWVEKVSQDHLGNDKEREIIPKGLYNVLIEKDESVEIAGFKLIADVRARLHASRGVCEDFEEVRLLTTQPINLQGIIEVADTVDDINQLVANILYRVAAHFSPRIPFYTLQQLLKKGKRTDEIFEGPTLIHGFMDDDELLRHNRKQEIQASDIIREIMDETEVLTIDDFLIGTGANTIKSWVLSLDPTKTPVLNFDETLKKLSFTSRGLKATINPEQVKKLYNQKSLQGLSRVLPVQERDIIMSETKDRHIENYYALQNQFPANYGIGTSGVSESAPERRKAQSKQLTSYLMFFEQLLANHFSQIANFKNLMSFDGDDKRTYFNQSLLGTVVGLEEVLDSKENYEKYLQERTADSVDGLKRKNKFLNHLLARFSERFTGYGMLLQKASNIPYEVDKKLITDKSNFLKDYPAISAGRGRAYDYTQQHWQSNNISGLEKRIARKLGIEEYTRRNLGDGDTEGFHMVEHILLRPHSKYPYPFDAQYSAVEITKFEAVENTNHTRCISKGHTLKEGEEMRILENEQYNGTYTVIAIEVDHFEIEIPFQESTTSGFWQRTLDIRYFIRTAPVVSFSDSSSEVGHTFCTVTEHNLQKGDRIELTGTQHYDGDYEVVNITEKGFEIPIPFIEKETSGRWMPIEIPADPYSLQLTFVLPNWMERYQNEALKKFVENTIQEETPAHITAYIQWLDKPEMQIFDKAFQRFLKEINRS
ncbi:hypothetical protein AWE51_24295 [Aquimarina aggregata]|uniref:Uncharacterized protein n=1 Tax=Aquimarina aggregata TaxID=1642818 RepID=A0A162CR63_9FLAO|nr:hypothetical protein [Aquimarina aggregata]KZS40924.1 hypothetical protein AWE51_24295 [Aquimarina aggregata]